MQHPKLSIITPSYNQGEFLEATIKSVLAQGYPNLEYIIIDGGSTDKSVEIIKKYEKYLTYWVSEKDKGQTDAINKGLEKSTGEILGWINSDDVYLNGTFFKVNKVLQSHPECIVVHGDRLLLGRQGDVIGWSCTPSFNPLKYGYTIASETVFWRRSAMQEVGLLKTELRFAMDVEFFCRLYKHGNFLKLNNFLGCFRCYADNKSSTIAHIGREEGTREWKRLFGQPTNEVQPVPLATMLRQIFAFLTHPRLIGIPYITHRILSRRSHTSQS